MKKKGNLQHYEIADGFHAAYLSSPINLYLLEIYSNDAIWHNLETKVQALTSVEDGETSAVLIYLN